MTTLRRRLALLTLVTVGLGWPASEPVAGGPAAQGLPAVLGAERERISPDGVPLRLILVLDGIPHDVVAALQAEGHFADFYPAARMISTFPSLSDVSLTAMSGAEPPAGYQVVRFDRAQNRIVGSNMGSLSAEAHAHFPVDSRRYTSASRALAYVFSYRSALSQLEEIGKRVLASRRETFVAYSEATDALLHVHGRGKTRQYLLRLESFLIELNGKVRLQTGRDLLVDIVSDHGSTALKGKRARLNETLAGCGFSRAKQLDERSDIAFAAAGIIGSAAISCAPERAADVAACLASAAGVDLAFFRRGDAVAVLGPEGEAEVRLLDGPPERYAYRMLRGDPLRLGLLLGVDPGAPRPLVVRMGQADLFARTVNADYPDPLRRIWRAFHGAVSEPVEVLISLADGYEAANPLVRMLARLRGRAGTHGSLTRAASQGVAFSNWRPFRDGASWDYRDPLFGTSTATQARTRLDVGRTLAQTRRSQCRFDRSVD